MRTTLLALTLDHSQGAPIDTLYSMASASSSTSSGVLDGFKLIRILDQDPKHKSANLLGEFTCTAQDGSTSVDQAVLILEKTHFSSNSTAD